VTRLEFRWWRWLYVTAVAALGYWWIGWPGVALVFLTSINFDIKRD
jgi:hypothetical protein